ncbi:Holliday junction resolvase [Pseudomonas fluorescens ABAC62]|nr:Holliday junction resolvase [Pseudomonas fluorescens ABAC62]
MAFSYRLLIAPVVVLAGWSPLASAFDVTIQGTVVSAYATSKVTSAPFDRKVVAAAQDDAAAFIATDGQWRGARLESALDYLRHSHPKLHASDLELAQAILVQ